MPISRLLLAAVVVGALAGCDPATIGGGTDRVSVPVAGRSVTIAAPAGFCVDPASTNVNASGAFVMVSDCALVGGRLPEGDGGVIGAVMTASISSATGDGQTKSLADVERLAATADGRAILSRSGRGDRVRILATRTRGETLYLLIEDRGPQPIAGVDEQFWRAFLKVDGQMTVLSVLGFEGAGVSPTVGLGYIQSFSDSIVQANRS